MRADGTVYVGSGNGELAAFTPKGGVDWTFHPGDYYSLKDPVSMDPIQFHMGTLIVDAIGYFYVPSPDADLWEVGSDGSFIDHLPLPDDSRALFTRRRWEPTTIYSGTQKGILMLSARTSQSATPTARQGGRSLGCWPDAGESGRPLRNDDAGHSGRT